MPEPAYASGLDPSEPWVLGSVSGEKETLGGLLDLLEKAMMLREQWGSTMIFLFGGSVGKWRKI